MGRRLGGWVAAMLVVGCSSGGGSTQYVAAPADVPLPVVNTGSGATGGGTGGTGAAAAGGTTGVVDTGGMAGAAPAAGMAGSEPLMGEAGNGGVNAVTALDPVLPEVTGDCPPFVSGSFSIGGNSGITMEAGPKADGGGSLVFYWHGTGSTAGEYVFMGGGLAQSVTAAGGVLVSPAGSVGTGGDCSGTATFAKDDFNWADQVAACAVRDHNIDPKRIYTTGCSAGGLQAGCMGAMRSSYIAAVVPNSGGFNFPGTAQFQDPTRIPALMTMHGGAGDNVIINFGDASATAGMAYLAAGGAIWVNCDHMSGHCGAPADLYQAGWEFMQAHPFGTNPSPYESGLPASFPAYCVIE